MADREAVFDLHVTALKAVVSDVLSGEWDTDLFNIEETYLKEGDFLVVTHEKRVIGMGALRRVDKACGEIKRMRVLPSYWGQGIGQTLLDRLTHRARELGFDKLVLDTTIQLVSARRLYEKNGFKETRRGILGGFETIYYEKLF
ncbi:GNAT family N-acetyltransferase [Patescibacteria group bacterium]|nr:GNAT family N-acetyltransferase [Patescibacteria group bacterium]